MIEKAVEGDEVGDEEAVPVIQVMAGCLPEPKASTDKMAKVRGRVMAAMRGIQEDAAERAALFGEVAARPAARIARREDAREWHRMVLRAWQEAAKASRASQRQQADGTGDARHDGSGALQCDGQRDGHGEVAQQGVHNKEQRVLRGKQDEVRAARRDEQDNLPQQLAARLRLHEWGRGEGERWQAGLLRRQRGWPAVHVQRRDGQHVGDSEAAEAAHWLSAVDLQQRERLRQAARRQQAGEGQRDGGQQLGQDGRDEHGERRGRRLLRSYAEFTFCEEQQVRR